MKIVNIHNLFGTTNLAGRALGEQHLPKLLAETLSASEEEIIVWDFSELQHVSASYFSATFLKILGMAQSGQLNRYFIFAALNKPTLEDLEITLQLEGYPVLTKKETGSREVSVLGHLDPLYQETLQRLKTLGEASAEDLRKRFGKTEKIQQTGWINRLAFLHRSRLVRKEKKGRAFVFSPVG